MKKNTRSSCTERFTNLDKLNIVTFGGNGGLVLDFSQLSSLPQLPKK